MVKKTFLIISKKMRKKPWILKYYIFAPAEIIKII